MENQKTYPSNFEEKIGFDRLRDYISELCVFELGKEQVEEMSFLVDADQISLNLQYVGEFLNILTSEKTFPADHYKNMIPCLSKLRVEGTFIELFELFDLKRSQEAIRAVINYFDEEEGLLYPGLMALTKETEVYPFVMEQINRIITGKGKIKDNASTELSKIRTALKNRVSSVSRKMQTILKKAMEDGLVEEGTELSMRNGRMVIPVRASDKRRIKGLVHDESATGKTSFIEPGAIVELNNEIKEFEYAENREIIRILTEFSDKIRPYLDSLLQSYTLLGQIDFIRAKALFARRLKATIPDLLKEPGLDWNQARHPLLYLNFQKSGKEVVPLEIQLNDQDRILLISGPNAGGKSVCLQTVGLLQYMFQCGLPVPAEEHSKFGVFDRLFLDFGDEQSLDNDLSTYSSHLMNMKFFLKQADHRSLILIDEFGTGTEPMLGGAMAQSILGNLDDLGVFGVITTHYTNLKHFASGRDHILNGAMLFDHQNMQPLYQLQPGKPGSSFAFEIARSIGLPEDILKTATDVVGTDHIFFDKHLREIARDKRYWENKRSRIRKAEKKLEEILETYTAELKDFEKEKKKIMEQAKVEAMAMLKGVNKTIEKTIREIKESEAEKERTKEARKKLADQVERIKDGTHVTGKRIEQKLAQLEDQKLKQRGPSEKPKTPITPKESYTEITAGDPVRMQGIETVGEVLEVSGSKCMVAFGQMITSVDKNKLEKITASEYRKVSKRSVTSDSISMRMQEQKMNFKPHIDLRGKRVEEALQEVQEFIDSAIMVSSSKLTILHGKGNGILRSVIRDYLRSMDVVSSCRDEHPDRGGAGITLVELDL